MKSLAGRRILFVGIGFYDYERSIVARMRGLGAHVVAFEERPQALLSGPLAGLLQRLPGVAARLVRRHEARMLEAAASERFDQVLVIKSTGLAPDLLRRLRASQPQTEFVLYQWDSLARLPGIAERMPLFDRVLTFDRGDAEADQRLQFRPLFFRDASAGGAEPDIDISFVGWLHSDRLRLVRELQAAAAASGLRTYVYLYSGVLTWLRLLWRGQARDVHFRPMAHERAMDINRRSRCVLDLPHAAQSGLTMRAIETLGLGRKLITTGADIAHYDFYSPANVCIVAADALQVDPAFVRRPAEEVPPDLRRRYSLDAWIADVAGANTDLVAQPS